MFEWLFRKPAHAGLPSYKVLEQTRRGEARCGFADLENSPEIDRLRTEFESELLNLPRRPDEDQPLLTTFLRGASGFFTITLPDSIPCLLSFSSPIRAAAYARIHARRQRLRYLTLSAQEFAQLLGDLRHGGTIQDFAVDVCPHCLTFPALQIKEVVTPVDILELWAICKSGELARESLYFKHAKEAAERGTLQEAKETVFQAIQHVTMESARLHLLLGKTAISLREKEILREARTFLEFLHDNQALRELLAAEQSGGIRN
jgi:hypothetical protein